jgi:dTDP-4-dehydrorhamnose reductase
VLKILITGGTGMLGKELKTYFPDADYLNGTNDIDLSTPKCIEYISSMPHYDIIIHTAAFTNMRHNESNPKEAYYLHADVVSILQQKCNKLIYISAQGKNYDLVYFQSKLKGENLVLQRPTDLVVRTNIYGNGGLVKWALNELNQNKPINGYTDVLFNPLSTKQLSEFLLTCYSIEGIINTGTKSIVSKYDFLKVLALKNNLDHKLIFPTKINQYQDLTVDLNNQYKEFNLIEGILES